MKILSSVPAAKQVSDPDVTMVNAFVCDDDNAFRRHLSGCRRIAGPSRCVNGLVNSKNQIRVSGYMLNRKSMPGSKFALTNGTLAPMVVVLEPKSFSITPDGQGVFRPLDQAIHVELSAMSARLEPDQSDLLAILAQSNPDGLQPKDPILTDANANSEPPAVGRQ